MVAPVTHAAIADAEQWAAVAEAEAGHAEGERFELFSLLLRCRGERGGYGVDQLEHAVQTASRAARAGARPALVAAALFHDAAKPLTLVRHGEAMAEMLAGHLDPGAVEVVRHHGEFMADLVHRTRGAERHRGEPWHADARQFAAWDAASFDPGYESMSLAGVLIAARWW